MCVCVCGCGCGCVGVGVLSGSEHIHRLPTQQVTSGIGSLEAGPEVSHLVLHIITTYSNDDTNTDELFEVSHVDFASRWVADAWLAKKIGDDLAKLESLVRRSSGPIRGYAFERLMHRLLAKVRWASWAGGFVGCCHWRRGEVRVRDGDVMCCALSRAHDYSAQHDYSATSKPANY